MTISECVSIRIREILYAKNISLYKLHFMSGLSKGTITSLIYNHYNSVNMKTVFIIIQTLNVSVLNFFDNKLFKNLDDICLN